MSSAGEGQPADDAAGAPCLACRGTGQVTSGLGGTPHHVRCPWCQGTGHRKAGLDAQEHPSEAGAGPPSGGASS